MARAILHVGYHKTATTWFQRVVYPRALSHGYVPRERVSEALLSANAFQFDPAASLRALALDPARPSILCEEALCGSPYTGGHMGLLSREVALRLHALLPEANVVVFVRSQPEMIAATYLQYLRVGGTYSPHRFLFPEQYSLARDAVPNRFLHFSFDHFEYDRLIAHYAACFGAERLHVFAYEQLRSEGEQFLLRFAQQLGLELGPIPAERHNVSYGPGVARIARVLNHFTRHKVSDKHHWLHVPYFYTARKRLLAVLERAPLFAARATPEAMLGEPIVDWIRERYWQSNRRLEAAQPIGLAKLGYPLDPAPAPVPLPLAPAWERWARV